MAQSPPNTLGKYQIIREIARSNDIVYEGWDPVMSRRVAVKELAMPGGSTDSQKADRIKRFMREAKAAGSLAHPNIVTVYEVGQEGDRYYIAMEFLDGRTLRAEMESSGFLKPERAVEVSIAMLSGLSFAHEHGVIHRDIKPENIQILESGGIKLTDFGIARLTFEENLTMDGQVFGTPSYMSPEQIHGKDIDARSDIFSVGVLLYEMVAGRKPFIGDNVVAITYSIMNTVPSQPQQASASLWNVTKTALEKTANMRYASAAHMVDALKKVSYTDTADPYAQYGTPGAPWTSGQSPANTGGIVQPSGTPINPYAPPVQGNPMAPPPFLLGSVQQPSNTQGFAGGQVIQQPYGVPTQAPYGAPTQTPYGTPTQVPYGQTYGQPAPTTYLPPGQGYPTPVPVYYPPPPRKPLFKAETLHVMRNLFISIVVLGLVIALLLLAINAVTQGRANSQLVPGPNNNGGLVPSPQNSSTPSVQNTQPVKDASGGIIVEPPGGPISNAEADGDIQTAVLKVNQAASEDFGDKRREIYSDASNLFAIAIKGNPTKVAEYKEAAFGAFMDAEVKAGTNSTLADEVRFSRMKEALNYARAYVNSDNDVAKLAEADKALRDATLGPSTDQPATTDTPIG